MRIFNFTGAALAASLAVALNLGAASAQELRLSHNTGDTTTWHKGAERFAALLAERSDGDVTVRLPQCAAVGRRSDASG